MSSCAGCSRRGAISALGVSLVTAIVRVREANAGSCKNVGVDVGPAAKLAMGARRLVESTEGRFVIARDDKGIYAFTGTCTHMGGSVSLLDPSSPAIAEGAVAVCASHASLFGPNGELIRGPATKPLPHLAVEVCNQRIYVDLARRVDSNTRA